MHKNAKRVVALLASVMMCSAVLADSALAFEQYATAGSTQAVYTNGIVAADSIVIYDAYGKDISNGKDSYIYLDNTDVAGGTTDTTITIKTSNKAGNAKDPIFYVREAGTKEDRVKVEKVSNNAAGTELKLKISAYETDETGRQTYKAKSGTTYLEFSTESGEVYRKLFIVIYEPTSDATVTTGSGRTSSELVFKKYVPELKDVKFTDDTKETTQEMIDSYYNSSYGPSDYISNMASIANHKYLINTSMTGTDKVQYKVFDGAYHRGIEKDGKETTLAEITKDGIFTPKKNGTVTIMVKAMPTLPFMCKETDTEEGIASTTYTNNAYTETFKRNSTNVQNRVAVVTALNMSKLDKDGNPTKATFTTKYIDRTLPKFIQVNIIKENPAKAMAFKNAPAGMQLGETTQLNLNLTPSYTGQEYTGATDVVEWKSSNEKVITVDSKGFVTAVGKGEATITAQGENPNIFTTCTIRVYSKASGVKISPSPASTRVGVDIALSATLSPDNAEDELIWESSDPSIATVTAEPGQFGELTQKAVVTGKKIGTVTITAKTKYSGVEAKCTVTVNDKIYSDGVELTLTDNDKNRTPIGAGENVNIFNGRVVNIEALLTSKDGSTPDDKIKWTVTGNDGNYITYKETSNNAISVNSLSDGTVTVTAASTVNPSIKKTFTISVIRACEKVTLKNVTGYSSLRKGETVSIEADLTTNNRDYPHNHDDRVKSWTSSDESVATVSNNGTITCTGHGRATITCTTLSGVKSTISVTGFIPSEIYFSSGVTASKDGQSLPSAEIVLKKDAKEGTISGTARLAVTVMGLNSTADNARTTSIANSRVAWTSSDKSVATVDENGTITATKIGQTTITATSGSKSTKALVTVKAPTSLFDIAVDNCVYSPANTAQVYTPKVVVTLGDKTLTEKKDYTVAFENNTTITTGAKVIVTGLGQYTGTTNKNFSILAKPLSDDDIKIEAIPRQQATGKAVTPEPKVTYQGTVLKKDTDYTLKYSDNVNNSTADKKASIVLSGKGNYTKSRTVLFEIYCEHPCQEIVNGKCNICKTVIDAKTKLSHDYKTSTVAPTYDSEGYTLHKCTRCGDSFKTDTVAKLPKTDLSGFTATLSSTTSTYTGSAIKPTVTVKDGASALKDNTDYVVTYSNNIKPGTATVTITGKAKYSGKITKTFTINAITLTAANVTGVANKYYTGKALTQNITVKYGSKTLVRGTDYVVTYKNNTAVGKATVTVTGKGNYKGTVNKAFKILPKKTTLKSLTSPKTKKMKATYTKVAGVTGYEVFYATNSKFTKGKKTVTVKGAKTVSKTISKLKKGTTYYVKVRTYKTVGGVKYYSGYSAAKKVKVK